MKKKDIVETRKDEIRYTTSDPKRMLGRFICRRVVKKWKEVFLLDTGDTTEIERSELLFDEGTYIDHDIHAKIRFYMEAGDIKEIEVSNQNRKGKLLENNFLHLYKCVVNISNKKHSFLLYAKSIINANTILTDYIELNRQGGFYVVEIKEVDNNFVIEDSVDIKSAQKSIDLEYLKGEIDGETYVNAQVDITGTEPDYTKMSFYQIEARITQRTSTTEIAEQTQTVIVYTYTATRANLLIEQHLRNLEEERFKSYLEKGKVYEKREIYSYIEECKILPIGTFIPKEFSRVYENE